MTTIAVAVKDGLACIASDSLTSFGDMRLPPGRSADPKKILAVGDSFVGLSGSSAHFGVLESYFAAPENVPDFSSRAAVFESWRRLHEVLKEKYFLNPKDEDSDPYESTQITALVASPWGLYGVFSLREVFAYRDFWAMGSGREYALGALQALHPILPTAREIAERAVLAACEFDKGSAPPVQSHVVKLNAPAPSEAQTRAQAQGQARTETKSRRSPR